MNMKSNEKKWIMILIAITIVVILIYIFTRKTNNKSHVEAESEDIIKSVGIDVNDEAYAGKKIYVENGDVIIENEDGSKTIESTKKEETDLVEASQEVKTKYELTNVNVNVTGNRTSITGSIKNNTGKKHKVIVGAKFYAEDNKRKGSGNTQIEELKAGKTQKFEIVIMGNMTGYTHSIEVEFTD